MAEGEDERPPGEEEDQETEPELNFEAPVVQGASVSVDQVDPKTSAAAEEVADAKNDDNKAEIDAPLEQDNLKAEEQSSTPASAPQAAVSATATETAASTASVDPYAGYAGYDPAAAGYDYSAYWAQYGYQSGYNYSGAFQPLLGLLSFHSTSFVGVPPEMPTCS